MRNCETCGRSTATPVRVVTQTRPRAYKPRSKANHFKRIVKGKRAKVVRDDPGGKGWEIAREGFFCPSCATAAAARPDLTPCRSGDLAVGRAAS